MLDEFVSIEDAATLLGISTPTVEARILTFLYVPYIRIPDWSIGREQPNKPLAEWVYEDFPNASWERLDPEKYDIERSGDVYYKIWGWVGLDTEAAAEIFLGGSKALYEQWVTLWGDCLKQGGSVWLKDPERYRTGKDPKIGRSNIYVRVAELHLPEPAKPEAAYSHPATVGQSGATVDLNGRKRNNLLRVIAALAKHVDIDLKEGGGGTAQVLNILAKAGFESPKEKTVRDILGEVRELPKAR